MAHIETYLVGGAVRDTLLGIEPKDKDYVVVGAAPQDMLDQGFKQVGQDFPVFLHPDTGDEYALARTERKSGKGYGGFAVETEGVTLEQDLARRDLTMNAMAMRDGMLFDPFGGARDLRAGILKSVSPAFAEDPLRVLRIARFAARYDFAIEINTLSMCRSLVQTGELSNLTPERCWKELERALAEPHPARFFYVLFACEALFNPKVPFFFSAFSGENTVFDSLEMMKAAKWTPLQFLALAGNFHNMEGNELKQTSELDKLSKVVHMCIGEKNLLMKGGLAAVDMLTRVGALQGAQEFFLNVVATVKHVDESLAASMLKMAAAMQAVSAWQVIETNPNLAGKALGAGLRRLRAEKVDHDI
jgi:tRNA nucleotidyltransferase/poly(A) polymerase